MICCQTGHTADSHYKQGGGQEGGLTDQGKQSAPHAYMTDLDIDSSVDGGATDSHPSSMPDMNEDSSIPFASTFHSSTYSYWSPSGFQDSYWSPIGFVRSPVGMPKSNRSPVRIPESTRTPTNFGCNWILTKFEEYTSNCIHTNVNYTELCQAIIAVGV